MQLKVDNTAHNKHSIVMMVMMTMRMVMDDKKSTYLIKFIIVTKELNMKNAKVVISDVNDSPPVLVEVSDHFLKAA